MPNRMLTTEELEKANRLLNGVRAQLLELANGDPELLFAYRRKVYKELTYDEREKPMVRKKLKSLKRQSQNGLCERCKNPLPEKYCVLDRLKASNGYTEENTRLICSTCDVEVQKEREYQ